jgi:hypothetical protein
MLKLFVLARSFKREAYFRHLFIDLDLDHYVQSAIDIEVFRSFHGQSVRQSEFGKVLSKSSLSMYKNCRVSMAKHKYKLIV